MLREPHLVVEDEPNSKTMLKVMDPSLHQMPLNRRGLNYDSDEEDVSTMNNSISRRGIEAKIVLKRYSIFQK